MSRYESGIASDPATAVGSRAPSETIDIQDPEKHHGERGGINVQDAEKQFDELARRLTRHSTQHDEKGDPSDDVEKQETFDLLEYLRSTSGQRNEAGFAHKHVGVALAAGLGLLSLSKALTPDSDPLRARRTVMGCIRSPLMDMSAFATWATEA
ncbi:hypothetical protein RSAG8_07595, partial [Rhizoctonia solani AG-8 WAC10335]